MIIFLHPDPRRPQAFRHGQRRSRKQSAPLQKENPHDFYGPLCHRERAVFNRLLDRCQHVLLPLCSCSAYISIRFIPVRYLRDAAVASQLQLRLNSSSLLLAEAAKSSSERDVAFVWELAAQCIMYILSCAAIVFTCLSASKRMRKMNAELEKTALVEVTPGQFVASVSSDADDSKSSLVSTRDLTDIRISSANSAVLRKVGLNQLFESFVVWRICSAFTSMCTRFAPSPGLHAISVCTQPGCSYLLSLEC